MQSSRTKQKRTEEEEEVANAENIGSESEASEPEATDGFVDQFEAALVARGNTIWSSGGAQKDVAIRVLIQCFGSMVESHAKPDAVPDFRGRIRSEDMEHRKLLDASKHVVKARQVLIKNENFDTRDFTIFISQKKWVRNILRPLLELCAREDSALAMNCCSLALILIKKMSDKTMKLIDKFYKKKKKSKAVAVEGGKDAEDGEGAASKKAVTLHDSQSEDESSPAKIQNAKEQVAALLSFKEALCSELCNQAITNAFRECWLRELQMTNEESKLGVARCISYFRRILSIAPHKEWSSPSEILDQRGVHNRYIVQLRVFLSLLPSIISDVRRSYHDDWLTDIVLILFYIFDNFKAQELFLVWKSDALMANFLLLAQEADGAAAAVPASEEAIIQQAASKPVVAPDVLKRRIVQQTLGAQASMGSLSAKLLGEKMQREKQAVNAGAARFTRFTSTYQVPLINAAQVATTTAPIAVGISAAGVQADTTGATSAVVGEQGDAVEVAKVIPSSSILLKDPFARHQSDLLPQAREKRNKKNMTFGAENQFYESSKAQAKLTDDGQRACVVAASLAEALTADVCFKSFVRRINEDLRRDELRISPDMEWQYFSIVTQLLAYNRLKLEEEYRAVQMKRQEASLLVADVDPSAEPLQVIPWEPNLINVIDSLDKMSFTRVTFAMESLLRKPDTYHLAVFPMEMYSEMLAYLRIMLESSNEGHHEIAIGALYRLFYTSTGQTDPLPRLLAAWKPGVFPKAHLFTLVEVVHQTLKTLEAAKQLFVNQGIFSEEMWRQKRKQLKAAKKEMDMELYLLSCLRFSVDDYFKRLVSNHTVSIYMRLLQRVRDNDAVVNHRVYAFLQRMCSFKLHDDSVSGAELPQADAQPFVDSQDFLTGGGSGGFLQAERLQAAATGSQAAHLGYMLFSVSCLQTFHAVLSDDVVLRIDTLQPLVRLIRQVVRDFGLLARRNHLLLVEALFVHPHAHDHCLQLHGVYEAAPTARRLLSGVFADREHDDALVALSDGSASDADTAPAASTREATTRRADGDSDLADTQPQQGDAVEDDEEGEFNDDVMEQRRLAALATRKGGAARAKKAAEAGRKKRLVRRRDASSSEGEEEDAASASDAGGSVDSADTRTKTRRLRQRETRRTRKAWSRAEDRVLRQLYRRFHGMASIYVAISMADELRALGSERSEQQIKHRAVQLGLHTMAPDDILSGSDPDLSSSSDDDGDASRVSGSSRSVGSGGRQSNKRPRGRAALDRVMALLQTPDSTGTGDVDDSTQRTTAQMAMEGVTSVEKDDGPEDGAAWDGAALGGGRRKRPFDDYDFDEAAAKASKRKKLRKPSAALAGDDDVDTAPQTLDERQLAAVRPLRRPADDAVNDDDDDLFAAPTAALPAAAAVDRAASRRDNLKRLLDSDDEDGSPPPPVRLALA